MKVKGRQVADAIADLPLAKKIPHHIRDNAIDHSKAIAKLLNTGDLTGSSSKINRLVNALVMNKRDDTSVKEDEITAAIHLIEKIATVLHPKKTVNLSAEYMMKALQVNDATGRRGAIDEEILGDYFDTHFMLCEQYIECRFFHDGKQYSLEITDNSDDYLGFQLYCGKTGSGNSSKYYDVSRHIHDLNYSQKIHGKKLTAKFRDKKHNEKIFIITLTHGTQRDFVARADLSISKRLLKDTNKRFKEENLGCTVEFID